MFWSGALMLLGRHLCHTRIENNGTCSNWHVQCIVQEINTVTLKKNTQRRTQQGYRSACCGEFGQF